MDNQCGQMTESTAIFNKYGVMENPVGAKYEIMFRQGIYVNMAVWIFINKTKSGFKIAKLKLEFDNFHLRAKMELRKSCLKQCGEILKETVGFFISGCAGQK